MGGGQRNHLSEGHPEDTFMDFQARVNLLACL